MAGKVLKNIITRLILALFLSLLWHTEVFAQANQAPVITLPGTQTTAEDTSKSITGISVSDTDAGANEVKMTIDSYHGTLSLNSTSGLTFTTGDGNSDLQMVFTGALADINNAISSVDYQPSTDKNSENTGYIRFVKTLSDNNNGFNGLNRIWGASISGHYLYTAGYLDNTVSIMDIADPENPVLISTIVDGQNGFNKVQGPSDAVASGDYLFITAYGEHGFTIADISDPANPTRVFETSDGLNGFNYLNAAYDVFVAGNYAYITSYGDSALTIVDISTPSSPSIASVVRNNDGTYTNISGTKAIRVENNIAYLGAYGSGSMTIIDVSNPAIPVLKSQIRDNDGTYTNLENAIDIKLHNNHAYISNYGGKITIVNVSDPVNPVKVTEIINGSGGFDKLHISGRMSIKDNHLYVPSFTSKALSVIDISDPANPTLYAEAYDNDKEFTSMFTPVTGGNEQEVVVYGNYVYYCAGSTVTIGDFSNRKTPSITITADDQGNTGDGGALTDTQTVNINITPVHDHHPALSFSNSGAVYTENGSYPYYGDRMFIDDAASFTDADQGNFNGAVLTVGFTANATANDKIIMLQGPYAANKVFYPDYVTGMIEIGTWSGGTNGTDLVITFNANATKPHMIQNIIRRIGFSNNSEDPSPQTRTLEFNLTSGSWGNAVSETRDLTITPVNDVPVVTVPVAQSMSEDTPYTFSGTSISDFDANSETVQATITSTYGKVTLAQTSGLSFVSGDGELDASMVFSGNISNINNALSSLTYSPNTEANKNNMANHHLAPWPVATMRDNQGGFNYLGGGNWANLTMVANDTHLFIGSQTENAITIVNIVDPTSPQLVSVIIDGQNSFNRIGGYKNMTLDGDRLFVAGESAISIIDISNPSAPSLLSETVDEQNGFTKLAGAHTVAVSGNYAYVSTPTEHAVTVVDISNPSAPSMVYEMVDNTNGFNYLNQVRGIVLNGNYLYATSFEAKILVINISDPTQPVVATSINEPNSSTSISTSGNLSCSTFITSGSSGGFSIYNTENPAAPVKIFSKNYHNDSLYRTYDCQIDGSYVYLSLYDRMNVYDASDIQNVTLVKSFQSNTAPFTGNHRYSLYMEATHLALNTHTLFVSAGWTPSVSILPLNSGLIDITINDLGHSGSGGAQSGNNKILFNIAPQNDPPTALPGTLTVNEDSFASDTLHATDPENDSISYSLVTQPSHGAVVLTDSAAGTYTYTPEANYSGSDSFGFKAYDGTVYGNTGVIAITVTPVADDPVSENSSLTVIEDTPKSGTLVAKDKDLGAQLTYQFLSQPTKGTVVLTNNQTGAFTYTPNLNQTGHDSFSFSANDGDVNSHPGQVSIDITPVNDAPVAENQSIVTQVETSKQLTLTATDVDSTKLTFSIVTQPQKGSISSFSNTAGTLVYTPNAETNGSDSFTFKVSDGSLNSNTATITIDIQGETANEPPQVSITRSDFQAKEGSLITLTAVASDPENDTLTYRWTTSAGAPINFDKSDSYKTSFTVPIPGKFGYSTIKVEVKDAKNDWVSDTVTMTILKKSITTTDSVTLDSKVLAVNNGQIVSETSSPNTSTSDKRMIQIGQAKFYATSTITMPVVFIGNKVAVGYPEYNNNRGLVALIDPSQLVLPEYDMDDHNFSLNQGIEVAEGSINGGYFGYTLYTCDINQDNVLELAVLSPGNGNGILYVLDAQILETMTIVMGSDAYQLKSGLMYATDLSGTNSGTDLILHVTTATSFDINSNYLTRFAASEQSNTNLFFGLLSSKDMDSVIDFAEDNPDFSIDSDLSVTHATSGDINGDGIQDLILGSCINGVITVYFGNTNIGLSSIELSADNEINANESTDFSSLAVSDVTGDGVADILVGYPDANSHNGRIYMVTGQLGWDDDSVDLNESVIIDGQSNENLGRWIVLADYDGDGVSDLITNNGSEESSQIINIKSALLSTENTEDTNIPDQMSFGSLKGAAGCSLDTNSEDSTFALFKKGKFLFTLGLLIMMFIFFKQKRRLSATRREKDFSQKDSE